MPNWSEKPPEAKDGYPLRIVRTPPDKPLHAIATSTEVLGCCTHFVQNRTIPCEGTDVCKWCQEGHSWRWHGYLAAMITATLEHILFEFTAAASDTFRNYQTVHGTMRGCHFQAIRPSKRHNGRIVIACKPVDAQRCRIPEPPDVKAILCHIWNIQNANATTAKITRPPFRDVGVDPSNGDGRNRPKPAQK